MSNFLEVGDRVSHYKYGQGVIERLLSQGLAEVRFGKSTQYVEQKNLTSTVLKQREERAKKEKAREEAIRKEKAAQAERLKQAKQAEERRRAEALLEQNRERLAALTAQLWSKFMTDFLGSEKFFEETCAELISHATFESEKCKFVDAWISERTPSNDQGEKKLPDFEQLAAIAALEKHVQVVARAGSGKTTTLVNRAIFLLKHCGVAPSEMLLLAFNRKAALEIKRRILSLLSDQAEAAVASDIRRRIREAGVRTRLDLHELEASAIEFVAASLNVSLPHVMTFHALAYAIVHPEENILYNGPEGESQELSRVFQQVIDDHLQIPEHRASIQDLMLLHFREDWDRIVAGAYDKTKEELLRFRRSLPKETLRGEFVKSFGEKAIADFLFEHDVAYKYERNHWWNERKNGEAIRTNYRPDFTIFKNAERGKEKGVIIEYFGLAGDADYDEMSEKKREYWNAKQGWSLLEFSPRDIAEHGIDSFRLLLKESLEGQGITCNKLSEDEIWERIRDRAIDRFTRAMVGFVGRCRKSSLSALDLEQQIEHYSPISEVEEKFLNIALHLYAAYLERLSATGEEDFDGLMQRASEALEEGQVTFKRKSECGDVRALRFIFIDEFQDFSELFYKLLTSIRRQNANVSLFCVGDDWQAINGFAGSDLRFFDNFNDYIGDSRKLYISTNYRSEKSIVDIGNALMDGLGKPAKSSKSNPGEILLADIDTFEPTTIENQRHSGDSLTPAILRIVNKSLLEGRDVVLLSRCNSLPWFVNYEDEPQGREKGLSRYLSLIRSYFSKGLKERITISTAHRYKGLEKNTVILLDAVSRSYPLIHPDWVFSRILGDSPDRITQEERRLLYVALTRAIEFLVIVTDSKNRSPFLADIEKKESLLSINWADFPPGRGKTSRLLVKVCNQSGRGWPPPTMAIKDQLKAASYQWQSVGAGGWTKSFPTDGFTVEVLMSEVWANSADGVEVRIFDEFDSLVAMYLVDKGQWKCTLDELEKVCAKVSDLEIETTATENNTEDMVDLNEISYFPE